ncbi:hypothetical protein F5B21DRAFT_492478 [Xylaria acuta]|nr:hypothetical protein F5B21DRAFT_492478 [Xylaria acuta]
MVPITRKEDPDAWVKVRRKKGRRRANEAAVTRFSRGSSPEEPTISLDRVKQDHDHFASEWKSSPDYAKLQELLSRHTAGRVTKAVCFGLGTFDPPDGQRQWKRSSHIQLTAFLAIVEHLQSKADSTIRCVFQDPIFNSVDKAFIASLGHEVVETPAGFQLVDSETMTFGIHIYRQVCSQIIATCIPAMYIGTSYEGWADVPGDLFRIESFLRLKELDRLCVGVDFPDSKSDCIFAPCSIFWRQKDET